MYKLLELLQSLRIFVFYFPRYWKDKNTIRFSTANIIIFYIAEWGLEVILCPSALCKAESSFSWWRSELLQHPFRLEFHKNSVGQTFQKLRQVSMINSTINGNLVCCLANHTLCFFLNKKKSFLNHRKVLFMKYRDHSRKQKI